MPSAESATVVIKVDTTQFQERLARVAQSFRDYVDWCRSAGIIPPLITTERHGDLWTSFLGGPTYRVCGRRGRPATFHWTSLDKIRNHGRKPPP